jgi:hypothetical protein
LLILIGELLSEITRHPNSQSTIENQQSKILRQYCRRVRVLVAHAEMPAFFSLAAAPAAATRLRKSPKMAEPEPDKEA